MRNPPILRKVKPIQRDRSAERTYLAIDGGGTRTVALSVNARGQVVSRVEAGPANVKLLTDAELVAHFQGLARALPAPGALGIGLAGAWAEPDTQRIHEAAGAVWPGVPCHATNDLEIALLAAQETGRASPAAKRNPASAQILIVSGTGSCAYTKSAHGRALLIGGWGHVLGDHGSAHQIGLNALKAIVGHFDREGRWPKLGAQLLRALQLNEPTQLINWAQAASKPEIAQLALEVFAAWEKGDPLAAEILDTAIGALAETALTCARRRARRGTRIQFFLAGSVLLKQPRFARLLARRIRQGWPAASVTPLRRESVWGAVELARGLSEKKSAGALAGPFHEPPKAARNFHAGATKFRFRQFRVAMPDAEIVAALHEPDPPPTPPRRGAERRTRDGSSPPGRGQGWVHGPDTGLKRKEGFHEPPLGAPAPRRPVLQALHSLRLSPTEQRNPRSMLLDKLPLADAIKLMIREDARVHRVLLAERRPLERALRLIVESFRQDGRLFYVGAGTSGRLGVLDASECPVTFRTSPEMVQAILAGGPAALWKPVEGAEDDAAAGAAAVAFRGVRSRDVVLGIAASGTTPFVWGALQAAQARRAKTVLLAFNPFLNIPRSLRPDVCIIPNLGPEILTGSTRLKAGSATKLVLNLLTTLAMVRLGKVSSNLMVDVVPSNAKLRDRATRIVQELTGADYARAQAALQACGGVIKKAVARLSRK